MTTSSSSSRRTTMLPQPPPLLATLLLLPLLLLLSASSIDAFPPPSSWVCRPGAAAATRLPLLLPPSSTRIVGGPSAPASASSAPSTSAAPLAAASSFIHLRNPATGRLTTYYSLYASSSSPYSSDEPRGSRQKQTDSLIIDTAYTMRRLSWFSWWAQVILTTISSVILLFARSIGAAAAESNSGSAMIQGTAPPAGFLLGGIGIVLSIASIFWTWGKARLSNRLLGGRTSRIQGANLLRRAITVGSALNLAGMLATLLGTFVIIGGLATKVLTAGLGGGAVVMGGNPNAVALQTVQPLDILIIQANANTLLSHFVSLFLTLFLTRFVMRMDPPSTED